MCDILCIEDDRDFFQRFTGALLKTASGLTPPHPLGMDLVFDLEQADRALSQKRYDAIFLDLFLPPKTDLETLEWLNHRTKNVPDFPAVIVITGSQRAGIRTFCWRAGAQAFMPKEDAALLPKQTLVNLENCIERLKDSRSRYAKP